MAKLRLPKAKKFLLVYNKGDGDKAYTVSNPIEQDAKSITVYAFGRGVRSFEIEKIVEMCVLGSPVAIK
jgi:hypothetical protein